MAHPRLRAPAQLPSLPATQGNPRLNAAFSDALAQLNAPEKASLSPIGSYAAASRSQGSAETLAKRALDKTAKSGHTAVARRPRRKQGKRLGISAVSGQLGDRQTATALATDSDMQAALARVGVRDVADILEHGVSRAASPVFLSKRTRQRQQAGQSKFSTGPKKLRQLKKMYAADSTRPTRQIRVRPSGPSKGMVQMTSSCEGKESLEELLECLAQRQMQTVQLQRMMLGELKFRRDPHRLSSLVQEIGTLEAQLCETEDNLLQSLKLCEWFVLKDRDAYGRALATCAQEVVAELTDEATEAYNESINKAHEEEWRLRIGVFLHSVPKIDQGSFETLVQHVASSRKDFTDTLAIFVETGRLNSKQRTNFESLTKQMQSEAQVAMEMSWRMRDSQRRQRAEERAQAVSSFSSGNLALDLQQKIESLSHGGQTQPTSNKQDAAYKQQRRAHVMGAETAVCDGIEDVRNGIRDMIARVRTRRQPVMAPSLSQSVPVSPAKPRGVLFHDDEQLGSPSLAKPAIRSPPAQQRQAFTNPVDHEPLSPLTALSANQSRLVSPLHSQSSLASPSAFGESGIFSVSKSHTNDGDTGFSQGNASEQLSPAPFASEPLTPSLSTKSSNGQCTDSTAKMTSEAKIPSPIVSPRAQDMSSPQRAKRSPAAAKAKVSPIQVGQTGLWNMQLLEASTKPEKQTGFDKIPVTWKFHVATRAEKKSESSGTNWSQTQAALQAVMQQAAYVPPSEAVVLNTDRTALAEMKRKHGSLSSAISVALQSAKTASEQQNTAPRVQAPTYSAHSHAALPIQIRNIISRIFVRTWASRQLRLRRNWRRWARDKEQSRWFQLTQLRRSASRQRKLDKYDCSILVLQRFCQSVPFMAARQFRRQLRRLRQRRFLKELFVHAQGLMPELVTTIQAQSSVNHQTATVIQAAESLSEQTHAQYSEKLHNWRLQLMQGLLSEKLPHNWEVQHESSHETRVPKVSILVQGEGVVSGVSYINVKTAATRKSHPNMKVVKRIFRDESERCEKLVSAAQSTLADFTRAVAVSRAVLCSNMEKSMAEYWRLLQGNQPTAIVQPSLSISPTAPEHVRSTVPRQAAQTAKNVHRVTHSPLTQPSKPSFSLAELDEDWLYGQSQIAPHRTSGGTTERSRGKPSKPVQVVVENRTVLSNMIADTKSRLSALLAKAMQ